MIQDEIGMTKANAEMRYAGFNDLKYESKLCDEMYDWNCLRKEMKRSLSWLALASANLTAPLIGFELLKLAISSSFPEHNYFYFLTDTDLL